MRRKGAGRINRRLKRVFSPGNRIFFILLLLFTAVTAALTFYSYTPAGAWAVAAEAAVLMITAVLYRRQVIRRRRNIVDVITRLTNSVDTAANDSVLRFPLPMVIVRIASGEILWANDLFYQISGTKERTFEHRIFDILPDFDLGWLYDGRAESPADISLRDRKFAVYGTVTRRGPRDKRDLMGMLYFIDTTELNWLRREIQLSRPVVAVLLMDNYDECMKNLTDSQKSTVLAALDTRVSAWAAPLKGILRKYERDKYILVFEERRLQKLIEKKFSVLDDARAVEGAGGLPVTLSLGIGKDAGSLSEGFSFAQLAIDMSLSRGGDQAVIKNKFNFEFYGGRSKEFEKRTKVKSRVMAASLSKLIEDSSQIFVMGHSGSDVDCIGAAAGIVCIARRLRKNAYIIVNEENTVAGVLIQKMRAAAEYENVFMGDQDAMIQLGAGTLLVMVDCARPELADSPDLLNAAARVAVIDHHRRGADYIDKAVLNFHEPYASSTCELVCELLQNICQQGDLIRLEAEAMLGGIVLDTKNFTMHTGARTFEAAAFLRGAGADTVEIKKVFQTDYASSLEKYAIIASARMARRNIAMAVASRDVSRTVAAQAADELLNIEGVDASFVLFRGGAAAMISGRSLGRVNVQMVLEKLGGGGHQTIAGAQLQNTDVDTALTQLVSAIDVYCEENNVE